MSFSSSSETKGEVEILSMRHGQSVDNVFPNQAFIGIDDPPLTRVGRDQAKLAIATLSEVFNKPDLVVTSCLQRAQETALIAFPNQSVVHAVPHLCEQPTHGTEWLPSWMHPAETYGSMASQKESLPMNLGAAMASGLSYAWEPRNSKCGPCDWDVFLGWLWKSQDVQELLEPRHEDASLSAPSRQLNDSALAATTAACSAYTQCKALSGDCCPNGAGATLDCCGGGLIEKLTLVPKATPAPIAEPIAEATTTPAPKPTPAPTVESSAEPTTAQPTPQPTLAPTSLTTQPIAQPTAMPTAKPSAETAQTRPRIAIVGHGNFLEFILIKYGWTAGSLHNAEAVLAFLPWDTNKGFGEIRIGHVAYGGSEGGGQETAKKIWAGVAFLVVAAIAALVYYKQCYNKKGQHGTAQPLL